jgi:tetratricopeptide (TPR) repeat protein
MPDVPWESEESRNHICMQNIVTNVVSQGLRKVFRDEWNARYQAMFGAWDDTNVSGQQLFNLENTRSRPNKNVYQAKFQHGDTSLWDCSVLFDAILYSNSVGHASLNPTTKSKVDNLRNIRNKIIHADEAMLSDADFQTMINDVEIAFKALGLPINDIMQIKSKRNLYKSFQVLPPKPTHQVVYRCEIINEIKQDLQKLHTDSDGKVTYFYISGNPGCGKSQLSRQLGEDLYKGVNWQTEAAFLMTLNAKDLDTLLYSYEDLCRHLNCSQDVLVNVMNSSKPKDEKIKDLRSQITTRIRNWKRWWIIVDNVEDLDIIYPLLPQMGDEVWNNGQIILTIQNTTSVPPDSFSTKHILLSDGMNDQQCRQLLSSLSETDPNDPLLDEVAEKLDHQPLAMAAAAVYLREVMKTTFTWGDYLEKLEKGKRDVTEKPLLKQSPTYSSTMSTAVRLTVEKCAENNFILNHTFYLFSLISYQPLPFEIIVKHIQQFDQDHDKEEIYLAIKHSSLFLVTESKDCNVRLHRVVHESIKLLRNYKGTDIYNYCQSAIANERVKVDVPGKVQAVVKTLYCFKDRDDQIKIIPHLKTFNAAVKKLLSEQELLYLISSGFEKHEVFQIYLFFGQILRFHCEFKLAVEFQNLSLQTLRDSKEDLILATIFSELGISHWYLGKLHTATDYHKKAMEIREKKLGLNHVDVASSYNNIGGIYHDIGELEHARGYHQQSLKIRENQLCPNYVDVATSYDNLGKTCHDMGELEQAKDYCQQALKIRKKQLGPNHVDVATSYENRGIIYHSMDELEQAKAYHQQALEIREMQLGPNHVDVAASYENLGTVYCDMGELKQAKDYHERALKNRERKLGSNHLLVANSYINLGAVYRNMGELEQANNYYQQALEIGEKELSPNNFHFATPYNNLGAVYHDMGELEQAKNYHLRAIEIREKKLGSNHVDVASSYNNLGTVYHHMGELEQAKNYYQRAVEIREKKLGSNHVDVASSYNNLGTVYHHMGELEQAKDYHQRALEIREKKLGSNHVDVASSYNNLGKVYHDMGELEQAKDYHQRAIEIREKKLGSNHVHVANSYNNIGAVYCQTGELEKAKNYHLRAIEIREKKLGSNHVDVATSYDNIGVVYHRMGELEKAKNYYLRAMEIRKKQLGSNHAHVATSYNNIGVVYGDMGELEKARNYHLRAMEIREKQPNYADRATEATSYNNLRCRVS